MKPNNYDIAELIDVLELNEERLYAWLVEDSPTVVRGNLAEAVDHIKVLRERIKAGYLGFLSGYEKLLPF